jgi:hypothetical protein
MAPFEVKIIEDEVSGSKKALSVASSVLSITAYCFLFYMQLESLMPGLKLERQMKTQDLVRRYTPGRFKAKITRRRREKEIGDMASEFVADVENFLRDQEVIQGYLTPITDSNYLKPNLSRS